METLILAQVAIPVATSAVSQPIAWQLVELPEAAPSCGNWAQMGLDVCWTLDI